MRLCGVWKAEEGVTLPREAELQKAAETVYSVTLFILGWGGERGTPQALLLPKAEMKPNFALIASRSMIKAEGNCRGFVTRAL